jgi:hypothetical protein
MASAVDVCNSALVQIGASRITSLTDNTDAARTCNQLYEAARDKLLRMHPWNFAIKRLVLAEETTTPEFDFDHKFGLPADCLRVLNNDDENYPWAIEGRSLLTDASTVTIKYIARITDVNQWDPLFREVLELLLQSRFAIPLMNAPDVANQKLQEFRLFMIDARLSDAQEGNGDVIYDEDIINARLTGPSTVSVSPP